MKRIIITCILWIFGALVTSCTKDSPLSDLPVSDPSLIKPVISLERERNNSGSPDHTITVYLYDKNSNSIELMEGGVYLNGISVPVKHAGLWGAPYYDATDIINNIDLGGDYLFLIELADGTSYGANVTVQLNDLHTLTLPSSHSHSEDLLVSWESVDQLDPLNIFLNYQFTTENGSGSGARNIDIPSPMWGTGSCTISSSDLSNPPDIYHITIQLISTRTGAIDNRFRTGRRITSTLKISGTSNIE